ncbi:MAG: hypothetical protein Q4G49_02820 [Paracoccus sp. (in: a-proteobacteria)]|nr:hypothetical protein [Paracoccus sp. (in: a-proteobacteria)]
MFAEKTELKLIEDLNENAIVVLDAGEVDEVSGAAVPFVIWAAGYYAVVYGPTIAKGAGIVAAGIGTGYLVNRR